MRWLTIDVGVERCEWLPVRPRGSALSDWSSGRRGWWLCGLQL